MTVAEGRAAAAISRLSGITRELTDRRALRERNAEQARQQARENLVAQGRVAEKVAKHMGELGRRQRGAGGWATEKTRASRDNVMGFGPEEDERPADDIARLAGTPAPTGEPPAPSTPAPSTPAPPSPVPPPQAQPAPPPPGRPAAEPPAAERRLDPEPFRRRGRHARPEPAFDDDDFSNNSWMK
ncbi:hypothetical protein SAMN05421810_105389 [Amycolatopsis arida]|uniref:Uncharacterized protein n=1 Tax=Amycolatopsis arida TaxID=587909 RepID=A0A1I5X1P6_9PSEU|nr:hypothetical protein [Amycolatopsis arida]TDX92563.1 hypothetical protein CLV69_105408 [Amycolatopsis arida]SFQ25935.1 hypothetical protein SAMN05421810_105389 [Amycolatopsis arida]